MINAFCAGIFLLPLRPKLTVFYVWRENVLIWPKQYPLLIKGLLEQNGAHILDALEQWPVCQERIDDKGIALTVLPPLFYLLWQKPAEPFQGCCFQHIYEYDDDEQRYIEQVLAHLKSQSMSNEQVTFLLLERLLNYLPIKSQFIQYSQLSLARLCHQLHAYQILQYSLAQGLVLSQDDVMSLWRDEELHALLAPYLKTAVEQTPQLVQILTERLLQGEDYFGLLVALQEDDTDLNLLEQALLAHIKDKSAKQSLCKRFLTQGATGCVADEQGCTAMMWAAERGFVDILVNNLSPTTLKSVDKAGNTLLHYAVLGQSESCIALLLKNGVDYTKKNKAGQTAYQTAVEQGFRLVLRQFEKDFGIKELSAKQQIKRIDIVHLLHALVCWLLPLQLFFFFKPDFDYKVESSFFIVISTLLMLFYAVSLKRCNLYPYIKHPWSLFLLRVMSSISLLGQMLLLFVVVITILT